MTKRKTWGTTSIGLVAKVLPGYAFRSRDFAKEGFPVVKIKNIHSDCTVCMNDADCIPLELISKKYDTYILCDGAMLIAMTGATAGKVGKLRSDTPVLLNQRVAQFKPFNIDEHFFWSVVSSQIYQDVFYRLADGAAQPNMSGKQIESVLIPFPPLPTQRRIASILSAYDDLIENNTRRITILEEMARRLYEEWFVNFRFPRHETARFVETELGLVPEGWEVGTLKDIIILQRGYDLPNKLRNSGPYPVIASTGYSTTHSEAKVKAPCVVTGRSGSIGKVMYISKDFWPLNTTLWGKSYPLKSVLFAYFSLQSIDFNAFNSGAAVPSLNRNNIHELPFILPHKTIIIEFDKNIEPIFILKENLQTKNANLRAQRDLLLPKLISGELDVSEAEDLIEEAAV